MWWRLRDVVNVLDAAELYAEKWVNGYIFMFLFYHN